ncbi:MAG TPA: hypothetical protein PKH02_02345 [Bacteroidales bacterium]|nr:hypothetical protein [Bacteroidales bacterium]HPT11450.1 hypothetical protein [Bacteroidales bacterium]
MKRTIVILMACFLISGLTQAQSAETITNSSVVKMVKARLSDELIIDMIQNSEVKFDLDEAAIQNLKAENVSATVIKEMQNSLLRSITEKEKQATQPGSVEKKTESGKHTGEVDQEDGKEAKVTPQSSVIDALGYVAPLKLLVTYFETEFETMSVTISGWNKQIKASLDEVEKINNEIADIEKQLREKKNANANSYDSEILLLYKNLNDSRLKYGQAKEKMLKQGEDITRKLADISKEQERSSGKEFDEVSQRVKAFEGDPSKASIPVVVTFNPLMVIDKTAVYIFPATEMLYWYQNELENIHNLILEWNQKSSEIAGQNDILNKKLEPMQRQMEEYKTNAKKFKSEISALKKQISATEKEKKQLAAKMETEGNLLADELKKMCKDIQSSARERFTDIIGNINYCYKEKLNL